MQRNWIGRSIGADVDFVIEGRDEKVTVFTTRPDTLFGATFMVVAPDSDLAAELAAGSTPEVQAAFAEYLGRCRRRPRSSARMPAATKTGIPLERCAINPVNGERMPIWTADYVLADYGHGAVMAVPAHDQRDLDFARTFDLPGARRRRHQRARHGRDPGDHAEMLGMLATSCRRSTRRTTGEALDRRRPHDQLRAARRAEQEQRHQAGHRAARGRGHGSRREDLPPARLADLAPALLGHADPDHPRRGRLAAFRCPTTSCPCGCRRPTAST